MEAGRQPRLHAGDGRRRAVAGEDDLAAVGVQVVEGVEELLLRLAFGAKELYVVEQQELHGAVAPAELIGPTLSDRGDEVVDELLRGDVESVDVDLAGAQGDRLQEVSLAQAGAAVDEERVVVLSGFFGGREGRRRRDAVGVCDNERPEGVARVQPLLEQWARDQGVHGRGLVQRHRCRFGRRSAVAVHVHLTVWLTVGADDLERDLSGLAQNAANGLRNDPLHAGSQPFLHELRRDSYDKVAVLVPEPQSVFQPSVIVRLRDMNLELAEGSVPDTLSRGVCHQERLRVK